MLKSAAIPGKIDLSTRMLKSSYFIKAGLKLLVCMRSFSYIKTDFHEKLLSHCQAILIT